MKKQKRLITAIAAMLCAAIMCGAAFAAGSATTMKTIEAYYSGIKLVVDGVEVTPKDANGKVVDPFVSDGTTYLPVRALANALGKEVEWDGETKTVFIGARPGQGENWMKKLPPYKLSQYYSKYLDGSDPNSYYLVGGTKITEGVCLSSPYSYSPEAYAIWNTNLQYSNMNFKVGHWDNAEEGDTILNIYLDDKLAESYNLSWSAPSMTINIPLKNAANVKFSAGKPDLRVNDQKGIGYVIYDISFS